MSLSSATRVVLVLAALPLLGCAPPSDGCFRIGRDQLVLVQNCQDGSSSEEVFLGNVSDRTCALKVDFAPGSRLDGRAFSLGGDAIGFEVSATPDVVASGAAASFRVSFWHDGGAAPGLAQATLRVDDGNPGSPPLDIPIVAVREPGRLLIFEPELPDGGTGFCGQIGMGGQTCSLEFSPTPDGLTSRRRLGLSTRSCQPITVRSLSISEEGFSLPPDAGSAFRIVTPLRFPVVVGRDAPVALEVEFSPRAAMASQSRSGSLVVDSDATNGAGAPAREGVFSFHGEVPRTLAPIEPRTCDFEDARDTCGCPEGRVFGKACLRLENLGDAPASVNSDCQVRGGGGAFALEACQRLLLDGGRAPLDGGTVLSPGERAECIVRYARQDGRRTGALRCTLGGEAVEVTLRGGLGPCVSFTPRFVQFDQRCGLLEQPLVLENTRSLPDGGKDCSACGTLEVLDAGVPFGDFEVVGAEGLVGTLPACGQRTALARLVGSSSSPSADLMLETSNFEAGRLDRTARLPMSRVTPLPVLARPVCTLCTDAALDGGDPNCERGSRVVNVSVSQHSRVWASCANSSASGPLCDGGTTPRPAQCRLSLLLWDAGVPADLTLRDGQPCSGTRGGWDGWAPYRTDAGEVHLCQLPARGPGTRATVSVSVRLDAGFEPSASANCWVNFVP